MARCSTAQLRVQCGIVSFAEVSPSDQVPPEYPDVPVFTFDIYHSSVFTPLQTWNSCFTNSFHPCGFTGTCLQTQVTDPGPGSVLLNIGICLFQYLVLLFICVFLADRILTWHAHITVLRPSMSVVCNVWCILPKKMSEKANRKWLMACLWLWGIEWGHVTDDATRPWKVKFVTPTRLGPNISKTAGDLHMHTQKIV